MPGTQNWLYFNDILLALLLVLGNLGPSFSCLPGELGLSVWEKEREPLDLSWEKERFKGLKR